MKNLEISSMWTILPLASFLLSIHPFHPWNPSIRLKYTIKWPFGNEAAVVQYFIVENLQKIFCNICALLNWLPFLHTLWKILNYTADFHEIVFQKFSMQNCVLFFAMVSLSPHIFLYTFLAKWMQKRYILNEVWNEILMDI